ncbi:MAG: hypothetical protein QGD96_06435, partial [Anaerolineae bacterium]|nr:hypothetical protein [Anaerolineae bacterium]
FSSSFLSVDKSNTLSNHSISFSFERLYEASAVTYMALWILIGALLASGRRKQKRVGIIFLVIYVVVGGIYVIAWAIKWVQALA